MIDPKRCHECGETANLVGLLKDGQSFYYCSRCWRLLVAPKIHPNGHKKN